MTLDTTVGEMATKEPKAIMIFKELGIDFCCDGKVDLATALREKKTSPEQFSEKLGRLKAASSSVQETNFLAMKPEALAEYIVTTHHDYLRKTLPETYTLFLKVLRVHGVHHAELYDVFKLFAALKTELDQHLVMEESLLFPEIADRGSKKVLSLAARAADEHENAGGLLEKIRAINHDYALPSDACMSYTNLYKTMREIEDDIHQHIHLENNILFKGLS